MSNYSPKTTALDAFDSFESVCDNVADESPAKRLRSEADAFEELTDQLAECFVEGLDMSAGQFAAMVADVSESLNKTEAKQQIVSKTQSAKADKNGREQLDAWISENLREVRVVRTTDHVDRTRYVWDFGSVTLETESGGEGRRHFNWIDFRDSIHDAGGPYLTDPTDHLTDNKEWREWIVDALEDRKTEKMNTGPRTNAVAQLQNRIRRSDAYGSLSESVDYNGVFVELSENPPDDAEPITTDKGPQDLPEWRVETIYIPNEWPVDAAEEYGISTQALQNEIDARGFMLDGHSKISTQKYVAGQYETFWVLDGGFATPASYQPEGQATDHSGVDALEAEESEQSEEQDFGSIGGSDNE